MCFGKLMGTLVTLRNLLIYQIYSGSRDPVWLNASWLDTSHKLPQVLSALSPNSHLFPLSGPCCGFHSLRANPVLPTPRRSLVPSSHSPMSPGPGHTPTLMECHPTRHGLCPRGQMVQPGSVGVTTGEQEMSRNVRINFFSVLPLCIL